MNMEEDFFNVPMSDVKCEIRRGIIECQKRGLLQSAKWLSEMNHGLSDVKLCSDNDKGTDDKASAAASGAGAGTAATFTDAALEGIAPAEYDTYYLAKSYFDVREYDRAAYFVRYCESPVPRFLHFYATYMAREKRRLDSTTDQTNLNDSGHVRDLAELLSSLRTEYARSRLDGYGMYLYGIVLKALNLNAPAMHALIQAIRLAPMLWSAYVELAPLVTEKDKLQSLHFGGHWMRHIFVAHTYVELYLSDEGLKAYEELQAVGFRKCVYVTSQMALAYHNKRDVDKAIEVFQSLQDSDPYRLDHMDTYSNLLFVKELRTEMAQLAHKAVGINKYSPETCCVIGNYYSIRCDHQMAILYFQRALKLNPKYLAAWTLMGHEFMELKNTNAAIQSYRKAVEVNKRDYRAWYGLGQSYEILKMHYYSLYYFKIAHQLRPYDSRMLVALGETYEKLDKSDSAIKCYFKACDVGDIEGIAMYKLANLHDRLGDIDSAVQCFVLYTADEMAVADKQSLYHAYITLANHFESKGEWDQASHYAYKCLESDDRKSEAKSLLKTIENKRSGKMMQNELPHHMRPFAGATSEVADIAASLATATATADTSSDDEMELEVTDYKFVSSDYLLSCRSGFKTSTASTAAAAARRTPLSDDMSLTESDSLTAALPSTSAAAAAAAAVAASNALGISASTTRLVEDVDDDDDDDDEDDANERPSMEISSISMD